MTVDVSTASRSVGLGRLAPLAEWTATFEWFGQQLADLNRQGRLEQGLRAVIAHHGIFHFNRLGLPAQDQRTLSSLAKEVVMGTSSNATSARTEGAPSTTVNGVNSDTVEAPSADRLRAQLTDHLVETGCVRTPRVEEAMRTVPRHLFVPNAPLDKAYGNAPVDTKFDGSGRSISCASQPGIVAMMLEQLDVEPGQKILELGAGTGFNAGLLGYHVGETGHVTTIDVDEDTGAPVERRRGHKWIGPCKHRRQQRRGPADPQAACPASGQRPDVPAGAAGPPRPAQRHQRVPRVFSGTQVNSPGTQGPGPGGRPACGPEQPRSPRA
ncbi:hypothetical protein ACIBSR_37285 [Streptomyces sp. NPDC049936]|uniref:hypothetical protein n=1 Tax=Streptomyces sp. NPDC049936 TaxID=3365599 RepID=UPI0037989E41